MDFFRKSFGVHFLNQLGAPDIRIFRQEGHKFLPETVERYIGNFKRAKTFLDLFVDMRMVDHGGQQNSGR